MTKSKGAAETNRHRSRFDVYLMVYDRFADELLKCGDPHAAMIAQSWIDAKAKLIDWLGDPATKVSRASMVSGMEQGLRETPMTLGVVPTSIRLHLLETFRLILQEEAPDFLSGDRNKLARIIERGRIRNEDEFYLVRHRLDE